MGCKWKKHLLGSRQPSGSSVAQEEKSSEGFQWSTEQAPTSEPALIAA